MQLQDYRIVKKFGKFGKFFLFAKVFLPILTLSCEQIYFSIIHGHGVKMSILKYFKLLLKNDEFSDPNGPLSREVPSGAIRGVARLRLMVGHTF